MLRFLTLILAVMHLQGCFDSSALAPIDASEELVVVTRNTPTTYFFEGDRASGFDYALAKQFARQHDMRLRVKVAFSLPELFEMLEQGEAHIAAAGLSKSTERDAQFHPSLPYLQQQALVVYKSGLLRPHALRDMVGRDLIVIAGSAHVESLAAMQSSLPELTWREIHAADSLELMQLVTDGKAELAIVDSIEFSIQQRLFPRVVAALELGEPAPLVWYLPGTPAGAKSKVLVDRFIKAAQKSGDIAQLERLHFGRFMHASRLGSLVFQRKVRDDLPVWQPLIETVATEYQMDWKLLAAISYQESHWDPVARSRTGVRGMMMLTQATASELGVDDRTDAAQSLRGGARFLKDLHRRLPPDIEEPDRTSMALAAYTIGMGHLEDARVLTERAGGDPHLWPDVRAHLPKLQNSSVYTTTRYGFAEGGQAVTYVDNIRHYEGILKLQSMPDQRISPPVEIHGLLPEHLRGASLPIL
ncbi:MAG: membrane-bound lytic murein transglycosylase MltF [Luminiphilus sp.]|jgi:membrane-bound lytic murein transglycosylase F|nr:membrane-bound lytic murein transglycosylase MltF [Luminiphilus sp.]